MAMTQYTGDTEIITNIGTTPQERGLTTDEFKAKFDEGLKAFVTWFNDKHKTEFDVHLAEMVTDEGGVHGIKAEEGTWTPVLEGVTVAGVNTYATQVGRYYRVGNMVFIKWQLALSSKDVNMSGNVRIVGLPFTPKGGYIGANFSRVSNLIFPANGLQLLGDIAGNIILEMIRSDNTYVQINNTHIKDNTLINGSAVFYV